MRGGRGQEQRQLLPSPQLPRGTLLLRLHLRLVLPLPALSELPPCRLTPGVAYFQRRRQPSHLRGGEDVQHCRYASPGGQQVPDCRPALPLPSLLSHLRPQNLRLHFSFRSHLEEVVSRLRGAPPPRAPGSGTSHSAVQVLSSAGAPCPSAGSTLRQASWCSQLSRHPACGVPAFCITSWRSAPRPIAALPPTSSPKSPA